MSKLQNNIKEAIQKTIKEVFAYEVSCADIVVEIPKDKSHGDYATNIAMQLARNLKQSPQVIAKSLMENLDFVAAGISTYEIAGPGFINLTIEKGALATVIKKVIKEQDSFGSTKKTDNIKYNVEFVSANPTGNLHPGHARGAAIGDSVVRIMRFAGYDVTGEYYINDAGNQISLLGKSLQARYFQHFGQDLKVPDAGYRGQDIVNIAQELVNEVGDKYLNRPLEESLKDFAEYGLKAGMDKIKATLQAFRVQHDVFVSERSLYERKMVDLALEQLQGQGMTYEADGALWLKTTEFGDDKDRVLIKSDGSYTYITPDIAYHLDKFNRGYDKLINFLGADHHGYVTRLKAGICALGKKAEDLDVEIYQMAKMIKDGKEYKMSKRTGEAVSLDDLMQEAGVDAVRYLFVSKAADTHMDLDLDLAIRKSNENPVYYVQYAHARMCSILKNVEDFQEPDNYDLLNDQKEIALMKQINELPKVVSEAAESLQPHKLCNYLQKLATLCHSFYNDCKVIVDDKDLQNQRVALVKAVKIALKNALSLIGVEAVERM